MRRARDAGTRRGTQPAAGSRVHAARRGCACHPSLAWHQLGVMSPAMVFFSSPIFLFLGGGRWGGAGVRLTDWQGWQGSFDNACRPECDIETVVPSHECIWNASVGSRCLGVPSWLKMARSPWRRTGSKSRLFESTHTRTIGMKCNSIIAFWGPAVLVNQEKNSWNSYYNDQLPFRVWLLIRDFAKYPNGRYYKFGCIVAINWYFEL